MSKPTTWARPQHLQEDALATSMIRQLTPSECLTVVWDNGLYEVPEERNGILSALIEDRDCPEVRYCAIGYQVDVPVGSVVIVEQNHKWVVHVYVDPAYRKHCWGTRLVEAALKQLPHSQDVFAAYTESSARLYTRLGIKNIKNQMSAMLPMNPDF